MRRAQLALEAVPFGTITAPAVGQFAGSSIVLDVFVRVLGFALLAGGVGLAVTVSYRWYSRESIPEGVAVLSGVALVAIWLNTQTVLQDAIIGDADVLDPSTALFTVGTFAVSAIAADGGRRIGEYVASEAGLTSPTSIDEVGQFVRAAGRVITVDLPAEIEDAAGYDPVDESTRAAIAGRTLVFPRRLTVEELRDRLRKRLESDYGIGYVDLDIDADGTVGRLAVGSTPAGIGPTLAPGSVAIALRGDPAHDATPGDTIEVWSANGDQVRRIGNGELRGTADDVVTLSVDAADASSLETGREYRLVTRPGTADAARALRALLRTTAETVTALSIDAGDSLVGERVESLPGLVLGIDCSSGGDSGSASSVPFPEPDRRLEVGDTCYVLADADAITRLRSRER
ncbi:potassium transporter TrkA [Natronosalvus vescus]|uniref:potassium transporter TrkA n=1 Tax=Natronosalvus vescus TaxID=2953881 RepID=UPI0020912A6A|nr:potassium transporter TrkA [Natronosalvus vescus]